MLAKTHNVSKRTTELRVFDSVTELIEHALAVDPDKALANAIGSDGGHLKRDTFVGRHFKDWKTVHSGANERWEEGLDIIERLARELHDQNLPTPVSYRRRTAFSEVDGAELDYDRLRAGQDWWRTSRRAPVAGPKSLTISVDVSANGSRAAESILWRGVAAIVVTEILEASGYRVELWSHEGGTRTYTDGTDSLLMVPLKRLSEPLDRSTLVNAISGWFFRTIIFAEITRSNDGRQVSVGLGSHRLPKKQELEDVTGDPDTEIISGVWDRHDAAQFVRNMIARFKDAN